MAMELKMAMNGNVEQMINYSESRFLEEPSKRLLEKEIYVSKKLL